jgi:large subunit ribosomal protein L10
MVSEKKKQTLKEVEKYIGKYPVIGLIDMHKMPARQLQEMKNTLRGKTVIKMVKKRLIKLALGKSKNTTLKAMEDCIQHEPALIFSQINPFELANIIDSSKSPAPAKPGDIAPIDIVVKAGPTKLKPGPVIGELQKVKLPVTVQGDKIAVKNDYILLKKGDKISKEHSDVLSKLGIEPMEIGLNLVAVYESGLIYKKDILFIPAEKYVDDLKSAFTAAFNLSFNANYITNYTLPVMISKAHSEALALASSANIMTKETTGLVLGKAHNQMLTLKSMIKEEV